MTWASLNGEDLNWGLAVNGLLTSTIENAKSGADTQHPFIVKGGAASCRLKRRSSRCLATSRREARCKDGEEAAHPKIPGIRSLIVFAVSYVV